jgi:RNA-dependent RNA polymerase
MDRLLILGEDCIEEKDHVKANILQLIDIYYDALDALKKGELLYS